MTVYVGFLYCHDDETLFTIVGIIYQVGHFYSYLIASVLIILPFSQMQDVMNMVVSVVEPHLEGFLSRCYCLEVFWKNLYIMMLSVHNH